VKPTISLKNQRLSKPVFASLHRSGTLQPIENMGERIFEWQEAIGFGVDFEAFFAFLG
jgi:hypothetical protein